MRRGPRIGEDTCASTKELGHEYYPDCAWRSWLYGCDGFCGILHLLLTCITTHKLNDAPKMKLLSATRSLLGILAIVGLVVGPIARPAMTMPTHIQAGAASDRAMSDSAAMAMPDDMPCCPKKAPIPDCGKDCLANCATQLLCNTVQGALVKRLGLANVLPPGNDTALVGLGQRPPLRPPKI